MFKIKDRYKLELQMQNDKIIWWHKRMNRQNKKLQKRSS